MRKIALHWQILITMVIGAVLGITFNVTLSTRQFSEEVPGVGTVLGTDSADGIQLTIEGANVSERFEVNPEHVGDPKVIDGVTVVGSLKDLKSTNERAYKLFMEHGRSWARRFGAFSQAIGNIFLRLLQMVSVPLIIASLLTGITGLGSASRLGSMFGRTVLYYVATSMLAIVTGLVLVNAIQPGANANIGQNIEIDEEKAAKESQSLGELMWEQLERMIPKNPFTATAESQFLSIISFSLMFGIFAVIAGGKPLETVSSVAQACFEVMMRMTMAIIKLAPIGVLFLMAYATATQGVEVFKSLSFYMITVMCALVVHACITLPVILKFIAKRSPVEFGRAMSPAILTAFSSASSNATLPLTMASVENRAGVSNKVSSFVLPLGATINMDGTALYEAVAVLFIAQLTPGFELTLAKQIIIAITALLASVGAAGIPHAGLVMMIIILQAVGLPTEMQGLIIAVDRLLDMCRTAVNVWSDSCGCAVIHRLTADE